MARLGEDLGFDSVWVGDHLLYRDQFGARGPWEAWTTLAAIAASTRRIALGPLVACTSFHNPAMLAKIASTVDEISGGRLVLGLGAGWNETEYRAFGYPFDQRVSRFNEAFTIIRSLLRQGRVDFSGEFYAARDCELQPRPTRPGGPPLLIGSTGERMLAIAIPHVDRWNAWYSQTGNRPEGVAPLRARVDAACRAAGRDPSSVERSVAVLVQLPEGRGRQTVYADDPAPIEGSPEEIADVLRRYAREGVDEVQLVIDPITERSLEALAPVLAELDMG
jgi:probable F420-dependent oxidoreductase